MAKTKKKKKTTYRCGKCKQEGHNARACPNNSTTEVKTVEVEDTTPPPEPEAIPEHPSGDLVSKRRKGSTPSSPGCFECPRCLKIGVLVLVEAESGRDINDKLITREEMRCEMCHTNSPVKTILKWGAQPKDNPAVARK